MQIGSLVFCYVLRSATSSSQSRLEVDDVDRLIRSWRGKRQVGKMVNLSLHAVLQTLRILTDALPSSWSANTSVSWLVYVGVEPGLAH